MPPKRKSHRIKAGKDTSATSPKTGAKRNALVSDKPDTIDYLPKKRGKRETNSGIEDTLQGLEHKLNKLVETVDKLQATCDANSSSNVASIQAATLPQTGMAANDHLPLPPPPASLDSHVADMPAIQLPMLSTQEAASRGELGQGPSLHSEYLQMMYVISIMFHPL